jgi:hypothetical protein
VLTAARLEVGMKAEVDEGVLSGDGGNVDGTASPAIATVGSSARNELLAAKAQTAVAARTGDDVDVDFVDEHRSVWSSTPNHQLSTPKPFAAEDAESVA